MSEKTKTVRKAFTEDEEAQMRAKVEEMRLCSPLNPRTFRFWSAVQRDDPSFLRDRGTQVLYQHWRVMEGKSAEVVMKKEQGDDAEEEEEEEEEEEWKEEEEDDHEDDDDEEEVEEENVKSTPARQQFSFSNPPLPLQQSRTLNGVPEFKHLKGQRSDFSHEPKTAKRSYDSLDAYLEANAAFKIADARLQDCNAELRNRRSERDEAATEAKAMASACEAAEKRHSELSAKVQELSKLLHEALPKLLKALEDFNFNQEDARANDTLTKGQKIQDDLTQTKQQASDAQKQLDSSSAQARTAQQDLQRAKVALKQAENTQKEAESAFEQAQRQLPRMDIGSVSIDDIFQKYQSLVSK